MRMEPLLFERAYTFILLGQYEAAKLVFNQILESSNTVTMHEMIRAVVAKGHIAVTTGDRTTAIWMLNRASKMIDGVSGSKLKFGGPESNVLFRDAEVKLLKAHFELMWGSDNVALQLALSAYSQLIGATSKSGPKLYPELFEVILFIMDILIYSNGPQDKKKKWLDTLRRQLQISLSADISDLKIKKWKLDLLRKEIQVLGSITRLPVFLIFKYLYRRQLRLASKALHA